MTIIMGMHYEQTEWLYAPGFVYHQYGSISRELGMIFPYRPVWEQDERFPLVVYIPGAAWHRQELYNDVPKYTRLAEQGAVFAIVQVRESDIAPFPAQIEDIHRAVSWLIDHAEQFHIDTGRIFLAGNSSGGHLALITAFSKAHGKYIPEGLPDYQIAGVMTQAASSDIKMCLSAPWQPERGKRPTTCLMGAETDEECWERADAATCKNYVTPDVVLPRVLLLHYAEDPVVNCQMSRDLYACLTKSDYKKADYYELAGCAHGGNAFWTADLVNVMAKFIAAPSQNAMDQYGEIMDITPRERRFLSYVRKRPPMYIGEYSLPRLANFLDGYRAALLTHDLQYKYSILSRQFNDFVCEKYGNSGCMGYVNAILQQIPDGKEAVETFFGFLDEFLEKNGFEKLERNNTAR